MAVGDFELREVEWSAARLASVLLALLSGSVYLAATTATEQRVFALLGLGLLVGFVVYFTDLWRPKLYLLGATYVALMVVAWVRLGMPTAGTIGLAHAAIQGALFALCLYLLVLERERERD